MATLAPGQIYWLDECPPLDGTVPGRHPVIIVDSADDLDAGADPILVVGITTTDCQDHDRVDLPNQAENPQTASGLPVPCCALPRWCLLVHRERLNELAGVLPLVTTVQIQTAVDLRLDDPEPDGPIRVGP